MERGTPGFATESSPSPVDLGAFFAEDNWGVWSLRATLLSPKELECFSRRVAKPQKNREQREGPRRCHVGRFSLIRLPKSPLAHSGF